MLLLSVSLRLLPHITRCCTVSILYRLYINIYPEFIDLLKQFIKKLSMLNIARLIYLM